MAHFAQIGENDIVVQVLVLDNEFITLNGEEQESIGVEFFNKTLGGEWLQTSYNDSFRGKFAQVGGSYDRATDTFVHLPIDISVDLPISAE
jgi:hypothetical protein